ncbi:MAG: hypothetical protein SGJ02_04950 [bacterium]|nr:hypothetical protein [bacterium]
MTYTEKILAEFDEMFPNLGATDPKEGWYDAKPEVRTFLTSKIAQALAEDRERVKGEIEEIHTELHNGRTEHAYRMICNLLFSLDTNK